MKKGIVALFAVASVTTVCWLIPVIGSQTPFGYSLARLIGSLALAGFACTFVIATRNRALDSLFNGLDKAYIVHRWTGIVSVALASAHPVILITARMALRSATLYRWTWGLPSLILFVILISTAIIAKKLNYETWKIIHKFMVFPYAIGVYHYYIASRDPLAFNAFNTWMHLLNLAGIVSAIYIVFLFEQTAFSAKYKIISVQKVANKIFEITGQATGKHITYRPGQFVFLKIPKSNVQFTSHPFTISNSPQSDTIRFTIKTLGDHTAKLAETIKVGDEFLTSSPYGMFDYTSGGKHQIWIAGGIGITPFLTFFQSNIPEDFSVDLFYAYNGDEGAYLNELKNLNKPNLRVNLIDSLQEGFLTVERIKETTNVNNEPDVYFCGPKAMLDSLRIGFKNSGIFVKFHFEEFTFGR
ncbi:MAG: ferric reductase-like transmembrane domain-containing protein [Oscillospiraceae bacterium]|nr:ferric reductase-like transmembrane domain-containing protein [Oscillospiraceae bacterium]